MFNLFRSNNKKSVNWKFIQTDIHSHILPGIDDGAQTIEDSVDLIRTMYENGYRKMIATPHVSEDIYPNTREVILSKRDLVRKKLASLNINMKIDAAAEYMIDETFVKLAENRELLTIHGNYVLVEMSYLVESPYLNVALFTMQTNGYQPILAHPERYNFYHNNLEKYDELREKGCLFQLNAIAFSGYYGKGVKRAAEYLFKNNLYEYCGSDIHHLRHTRALNSVLDASIISQLQEYHFANKKIELTEQPIEAVLVH